ncbi:MAG TPA: protein kinase, partial [Pyrinomonadaceae bacterium]|nr:protein kinase [Pyrinomonadaceae bacterium]
MEAERIEKIEELFHAALEVSPSERAYFLNKTCGADKELIREVESLLVFEESSEQILDASTEELAAELFSEINPPNDLIGVKIGHFKIEKLLGKGGMGEVYLAEDVKLDRKVALKFLPPEFVQNKDRLNRFVREAKTASALNHPNIITIYEINEFDGIHLIATEFIDGQTLNGFTKNESLSVETALNIAVQIASALDEAHSAGIVHRDIKPDNVMIRANGIVKVLDFGIAKLLENEQTKQSEKIEINPNYSQVFHNSTSTMAGLIMGTAEYMSPEQARGKKIDTRTDIFSFGVMFYQLLTGKLPFEGENAAEIIDAILHREPKPFDNPEIPFEIEKIVGKCLQKNREDRYQTIGNVLEDLKEVRRSFGISDTISPIHHSNGNIETRTKSLESVTTKEIFGRKMLSNKMFAIGFAVLLISLAAFFGYQTFSAKKQIRSVAVMPFVNESGNQNIEYLSDGMTEMLIRSLANIPNLSLKARSTVFTYKGKEKMPQQIGAELKVDAILLGRLSLRGEDLELHLELVETATQDVLWSENYERKLNELALLQNELVADVTDKLRLKLTAAEQKQAAKIYTTDSEAQQLYLKGRFHWNKRTVKDFERAIDYFNQAVEKDPNYALAYTGLADALALMPLYGNFRP